MTWVDILGLMAAMFTSLGFFPQIMKIWRTKSTEDISTVTYLAFCTGFCLWIAYGVLHGAFPVIVANVISLISCVIILKMKFSFEKKKS